MVGMSFERTPERILFRFASGGTTSQTEWFGKYSSMVLYVPSEFNGDTLTVKSSIGDDTGFTMTLATGRNELTSDQLTGLFPMNDIVLTTSVPVSADAVITADCKA